MKSIKSGNAFVCEYVALGAYGKHNLINAYSGDIRVLEFPALIPLAFFLEIFPDPEMPPAVKFEVFQNKKLKAAALVEFQFEPDKPGVIILPQVAFTITKKSKVRVVASCEGYRRTTLVEKAIDVGEISAA